MFSILTLLSPTPPVQHDVIVDAVAAVCDEPSDSPFTLLESSSDSSFLGAVFSFLMPFSFLIGVSSSSSSFLGARAARLRFFEAGVFGSTPLSSPSPPAVLALVRLGVMSCAFRRRS